MKEKVYVNLGGIEFLLVMILLSCMHMCSDVDSIRDEVREMSEPRSAPSKIDTFYYGLSNSSKPDTTYFESLKSDTMYIER